MKFPFKSNVMVVFILAGLSGCASMQPTPAIQMPAQHAASAPDPVMLALAESAETIRGYMRELKSVQTAEKLPKISPEQKKLMDSLNNSVPEDLKTRITIPPYSGRADNLIKAIAQAIQWDFMPMGQTPPIIPTLSKTYNDTPVEDILRDIGYSVSFADIVLDPTHKRIILRYKTGS